MINIEPVSWIETENPAMKRRPNCQNCGNRAKLQIIVELTIRPKGWQAIELIRLCENCARNLYGMLYAQLARINMIEEKE